MRSALLVMVFALAGCGPRERGYVNDGARVMCATECGHNGGVDSIHGPTGYMACVCENGAFTSRVVSEECTRLCESNGGVDYFRYSTIDHGTACFCGNGLLIKREARG